jgi:lipoprotein
MSGWRRSTADRLTRAVVRLAALVLAALAVAAMVGCAATGPAGVRHVPGEPEPWAGRCVAADPVVVQAATGADVSAAVWPGLATADPWALVGGLRLMGGRGAWWADTRPLRR